MRDQEDFTQNQDKYLGSHPTALPYLDLKKKISGRYYINQHWASVWRDGYIKVLYELDFKLRWILSQLLNWSMVFESFKPPNPRYAKVSKRNTFFLKPVFIHRIRFFLRAQCVKASDWDLCKSQLLFTVKDFFGYLKYNWNSGSVCTGSY